MGSDPGTRPQSVLNLRLFQTKEATHTILVLKSLIGGPGRILMEVFVSFKRWLILVACIYYLLLTANAL
eukprot:scaffold56561_cov16-Tisochrysis_lutea.AAC.1